MSGNYDNIINLPHHVSPTRTPMPMEDRAAQFSPFAALTGYDDAVRETARLTGRRIELDEYEKAAVNEKLLYLSRHIRELPRACITYFVPDEKKSGGRYETKSGRVKKLDEYNGQLLMEDQTLIPVKEVLEILVDSEVEKFPG